jgi:hypothetical protein
MASIGQIWRDPDGNQWVVIGASGPMVLVGNQWRDANLESSGWTFIK